MNLNLRARNPLNKQKTINKLTSYEAKQNRMWLIDTWMKKENLANLAWASPNS